VHIFAGAGEAAAQLLVARSCRPFPFIQLVVHRGESGSLDLSTQPVGVFSPSDPPSRRVDNCSLLSVSESLIFSKEKVNDLLDQLSEILRQGVSNIGGYL
jgi:hypothetical protein